jgi:hypothetical protein
MVVLVQEVHLVEVVQAEEQITVVALMQQVTELVVEVV